MECPQCGQQNPDGTMICEKCDHILDPSFLGGDYTDEADGPADLSDDEFDEDTPTGGADDTFSGDVPEAPREGRAARRSYVVGKGSDSESFDDEDLDEGDDEEGDEIERQLEELRQKRMRSEPAKPGAASRPVATQETDLKGEISQVQKDVEGTFSKIGDFWKALAKLDKIVLGGGLGMVLFTFFPWVNVSSQGSRAGLEVGGWLLALLGAATCILVYLRQEEHWKKRAKYVLFAQAAVSGLALLFLLVKMATLGSLRTVTPDGQLAPPGLYSVSMGIGLVLALVATLAVFGSTGYMIKETVLKK